MALPPPPRAAWAPFFLALWSPSLACGVFLTTSASEPSLFSVLCLAASSPLPFPPPGSSSLSCLVPDSSSSPRSPWPASGPGPDSRLQVTLLPPFLSDQAQHVHALGTFHLFCHATGERGSCPGGGRAVGASSTSTAFLAAPLRWSPATLNCYPEAVPGDSRARPVFPQRAKLFGFAGHGFCCNYSAVAL